MCFVMRRVVVQEDPLISDVHRPAILGHMVMVHQSVIASSIKFEQELRRRNYVTPKNYLDFISNYRRQIANNKKRIGARVKRLESGLTRLNEAATAVDRMTLELKEKKVIVDSKTKDVESLIRDIADRQKTVDIQNEEAQKKQVELQQSAKIIEVESAKANEALEEAVPALEAAAEALDNLDKNDIVEIRSFAQVSRTGSWMIHGIVLYVCCARPHAALRACAFALSTLAHPLWLLGVVNCAQPPHEVMMVCMCVLHLRPTGREDENAMWKGARAMMSDVGFLKALKEYKKDDIKEKQIKKVQHYIKEGELSMEKMRSVSKAGAGLLQWVDAIVKYYDVAKNVAPLRNRVREMEKEKAKSERELLDITTTLTRLNAEIKDLSENYEKAASELKSLQEQAALMEKRLTAASKLILGLASERSRWGEDVSKLQSQEVRLVGDGLLFASFLSYLGPFTFDYRQSMLQNLWLPDVLQRKLPLTQPFSGA